jgi:hypothetical protein
LLAAAVEAAFGQTPLAFEPNLGQSDAPVQFTARGSGYGLFLTDAGIATLSLRSGDGRGTVVRMTPINGASSDGSGQQRLPGRVNSFVGDASAWRTNVPTFGRVEFDEVYPGVDLVYYGTDQRQLEYDFVVAPGADPSSIALRFDGASRVELTADGLLLLHTDSAPLRLEAPVTYQKVRGQRVEVQSRYELSDDGTVRFDVGDYDPRLTLIIDPVLGYSTYLGGTGYDAVNDVAVGADGSAYVTGQASTETFPTTPGAFQTDGNEANNAAFITKYDPSGAVVYSTYLGGGWGSHTIGHGIAVDSAGSAYVTGEVQANDFPITPGAYNSPQYDWDTFVTKLSPNGSALVYSARIGGEWADHGRDIALGADGSAYITGHTFDYSYNNPRDFPTTPGAFKTAFVGDDIVDAFITKLNPAGSTLVYSTLLGGADSPQGAGGYEFGEGIVVDSAGHAYVTGDTHSALFPTTAGAFDRTLGGAVDAFVVKFNTTGSALIYSSYLGGNFSEVGGRDRARAIAIDAAGHAYVTGYTDAYKPTFLEGQEPNYGNDTLNFPTTPRAFQPEHSGFQSEGSTFALTEEAFVTKFAPDGSSLIYSTYLGGTTLNNGTGGQGMDQAWGIAVDSAGFVTIVGKTESDQFPIFNPLPGGSTYPAYALEAGFVTRLGPDGSSLAYSSYLGRSTIGRGAAVMPDGAVVAVGETRDMNFPVTPGAAQPANGGPNSWGEVSDGFVTRVNDSSPAAHSVLGLSIAPEMLPRGARANITVTLNNPAPAGGINVALQSGRTDVVNVPSSVFVPAGQTSATVETSPTTIPPGWDYSVGALIISTLNGSRREAMMTVTPSSFAATDGVFDVNGTGGPVVRITFERNIANSTLDASDLRITDLDSGAVTTPATSVSYNGATRTATWVLPPALPDGDYRATLPAGSVQAVGGDPLWPDHNIDFFIMAGDADHNGVIDGDDYALIDTGFNQGLSGWSNGDFNYDGLIDGDDYAIIDLAFNTQ